VVSEQDLAPYRDLAHKHGLMDPRVPDLLDQAAIEVAKMIRAGDHYRRKAARRVDLLSAAKRIDGLRKAFGRLDASTSFPLLCHLEPEG
jgi:hypothetical protein